MDNLLTAETYLLTEEGAAAFLALAPESLRDLRKRGQGPVVVRIGRRVRYLREDLRAWAESRREPQAV